MVSPIGATRGSSYELLTPFTRVISINKWIHQYIKLYKKENILKFIEYPNENSIDSLNLSSKKSLFESPKSVNREFKDEKVKNSIYTQLTDDLDKNIRLVYGIIKEFPDLSSSINDLNKDKPSKKDEILTLCLKLIEGLFKKNSHVFKENLSVYNSIFILNTNNKDNKNYNTNDSIDSNFLMIDIFQKIISCEEFLKCVIICALEIILFIDNIQEVFFFKIAEKLNLDVFYLLKIINPIMTFDLINVSYFYKF
jgi:hypothetical protein